MEKKELTCIRCPLGCQITVTLDNGEVKEVTGNSCPNGDKYARKEVVNPTRIVTSLVRITGGEMPVISVKTKDDVPKSKIFEVLDDLKPVIVEAPKKIGDVIIKDVAGTGVDIVATRNVAAK